MVVGSPEKRALDRCHFTKPEASLAADEAAFPYPVSHYKFSFLISIHFLQKQWGEAVKISAEVNLKDRVLNSHDLPNR